MFGFKIHLHLEDAFLIVCRQVLFSKTNKKTTNFLVFYFKI